MPDTVQTAPEQPAQVAQTSSENKGGGNTSMSDFAKKLLAGAQAAAIASEPKKDAAPPPKEEVKQETSAEEKAEEPKEEAKAETTEETESESSEVLSPETHSLDPKLQEILDKRIGKEVSKRYKLNERIAELEAKLAQLPTEIEKEVPVPVPADMPLGNITTLEQLNAYKENLQNDIVDAEMLLYSDFPPEGKMTKWGHVTKDGLIAALAQAKKDERTAIPAREKFLTMRSQAQQTAQEKYPFLKDPTHPGYQMAKQALKENPILRNYPNADHLVGMIVKGQLAELAEKEKSKPETKSPPKPKSKPTNGQAEITSDASMTRPPAGLINQQALQAERAKITGGKKSLGHKDFAELLKANQRFRNSQ